MNIHTSLPAPFSVSQLAHRWGCSEGLIRKLIREGRLQCFRPGTLIRIAVSEVERYECQNMQTNIPSSDSAADLPSSGKNQMEQVIESAVAVSLPRKIGRAPKRKPVNFGKERILPPGP